ncbi:MAG: diphthine synthase [halophilic archaeon J07HX64]|nr:MAG: diphthine synthase [halophilic archaeon J07HX64]
MLGFVGLGLYDERSVTLRGREELRAADRVFAEQYTSILAGASLADLERAHGVEIELRDRTGVERDPEPILAAAETGQTVFLVGGDPMVSTTHVDLRLRADDRGIETQVVHGTTAQTAASSLTGLQNYRFGKATTLPFPDTHGGVPGSVLETIGDNRERGLHTLVYLDIDAATDRLMTGDTAAGLLADHLDCLGVVVAQAGSDDPLVRADRLGTLATESFGPPLHLLVVPGELHPMERDALRALDDGSSDALNGD